MRSSLIVNPESSVKPVFFIHGIAKRSGTNFLHQALLLHPEIVDAARIFKEDWFMAESDFLEKFVNSVWKHWKNPRWQVPEEVKKELFRCLGDGLHKFLKKSTEASEKNTFAITKTPAIQNLSRFKILFPENKQVILVRDPRDISASALHTWKKPIQISLREWDNAVCALAAYELDNSEHLLVRYEDLMEAPERTLNEILNYLSVDKAQFPWSQFEQMGVFGSSGSGWGYRAKASTFNPVGRWRDLPTAEKSFLNECRPTWQYLGYDQLNCSLPDMSKRQKLAMLEGITLGQDARQSSPTRSEPDSAKSRLKWLCFALLGEEKAKHLARKIQT